MRPRAARGAFPFPHRTIAQVDQSKIDHLGWQARAIYHAIAVAAAKGAPTPTLGALGLMIGIYEQPMVAAHYHVSRLVTAGLLVKHGNKRERTYEVAITGCRTVDRRKCAAAAAA